MNDGKQLILDDEFSWYVHALMVENWTTKKIYEKEKGWDAHGRDEQPNRWWI